MPRLSQASTLSPWAVRSSAAQRTTAALYSVCLCTFVCWHFGFRFSTSAFRVSLSSFRLHTFCMYISPFCLSTLQSTKHMLCNRETCNCTVAVSCLLSFFPLFSPHICFLFFLLSARSFLICVPLSTARDRRLALTPFRSHDAAFLPCFMFAPCPRRERQSPLPATEIGKKVQAASNEPTCTEGAPRTPWEAYCNRVRTFLDKQHRPQS